MSRRRVAKQPETELSKKAGYFGVRVAHPGVCRTQMFAQQLCIWVCRTRLVAARLRFGYVARVWLRRGLAFGYFARVWLRRDLGFGYVARSCMQSNARQRCAAYNGVLNTSPHTKSPFNSVHSVPLRSGACLLLAPNQRGLADTRANNRWLPVQSPPSTFCARAKKTTRL